MARMGTQPTTICQAVKLLAGRSTGQRFMITVPSAQVKAAPTMQSAPSGDRPTAWISPPNRNSIPPNPSATPRARRRVNGSPSSQADSRTPQTGMV